VILELAVSGTVSAYLPRRIYVFTSRDRDTGRSDILVLMFTNYRSTSLAPSGNVLWLTAHKSFEVHTGTLSLLLLLMIKFEV
jgi:hypothetical protein